MGVNYKYEPSSSNLGKNTALLLLLIFWWLTVTLLFFIHGRANACPHCMGIFLLYFWPANVRLGSGEHRCKECAKIFDDGSREWPELPLGRRLRFSYHRPSLQSVEDLCWPGILSFFIPPRDEHSLLVVATVSAFGLIPILVWSPVRLIWVLRSKQKIFERTSSGPLLGVG